MYLWAMLLSPQRKTSAVSNKKKQYKNETMVKRFHFLRIGGTELLHHIETQKCYEQLTCVKSNAILFLKVNQEIWYILKFKS